MRLWHKQLLPYLPTMQLLGQHRECCAMRGNGWGRKHKTVDYVWKYRYEYLVNYHLKVIDLLECRLTSTGKKYNIDQRWKDLYYRGKNRPPLPEWGLIAMDSYLWDDFKDGYKEHNKEYLFECIYNLEEKIKDASYIDKYPKNEVKHFEDYADLLHEKYDF